MERMGGRMVLITMEYLVIQRLVIVELFKKKIKRLNTMKFFICICLLDISWAFIESQVAEKLIVQSFGVARFALQTEIRKALFQDITFHLYTKQNPNIPTQLFVNDQELLLLSPYRFSYPTVIIIHGYTDHKDRDIIVRMRNSLVENTEANVIVLDWKPLASLIYFNAASSAITAGHYLKEFLIFLEDSKVDLSLIHLVGHSLGGQIAGVAGGDLNGRVGRITALDPAGPLFDYVYVRNETESLDASDAKFVDVIHTAGTTFGIMRPIGHADFYPNHGTAPQPGCTNILLSVSCSHIRAVDYFIESLNSSAQFLAKKCTDFHYNILMNCSRDTLVPMGYYTPTTARGSFYLQTNPETPFAMGNKFFKTPF